MEYDPRGTVDEQHRLAFPGRTLGNPKPFQQPQATSVLAGRLPSLTGDVNPLETHPRSSSISSSISATQASGTPPGGQGMQNAPQTPPLAEAASDDLEIAMRTRAKQREDEARRIVNLDDYVSSLTNTRIDEKAFSEAFDCKMQAEIVDLEARLVQRLSSPAMPATGESTSSIAHLAGCVEGLLSSSGNHREQVDRMELMVRSEIDELRSWSQSQQDAIANLAQAYESVQARLEESRNENESLLARMEVNNCKVVTLQGQLGTLQSLPPKGDDGPTAEAYLGLAELTANLQRTVEMLENRLESVRSQHEEAFRKTDELLEVEVQARASDSQLKSILDQRLVDLERKLSNMEQRETDPGRMQDEIRSLVDRSQVSFQERLDGFQNQIVQIFQDIDSMQDLSARSFEANGNGQAEKFEQLSQAILKAVKERDERIVELQANYRSCDERFSMLDTTLQKRLGACEQNSSMMQESMQMQSAAHQRLEGLFTDCREEFELLRQQVQKVQWNVDQTCAQAVAEKRAAEENAAEEAAKKAAGEKHIEERLAALDGVQLSMATSEKSIAKLFEDLGTQSSLCQRLEDGLGSCQEESDNLKEQVQRVNARFDEESDIFKGQVQSVNAKFDEIVAKADMMGEERTVGVERIAVVEGELERLKQTSSDMNSACRSKIEEVLERLVLMRTDSEAVVTHYNEMEATWRSHFDEMQTRSNASVAVAEDIGRRFEELQDRFTSVCADLDGKLVFHVEELRKQLRLEMDSMSARIVDSASVTSQIEAIRVRAESFATQIPDGDALGSQIDGLRQRVDQVETIAAKSADKELINAATQGLSDDKYSARIESLQHCCGQLQGQLTELTASQGEYNGLPSVVLDLQQRINALEEQPTQAADASSRQLSQVQDDLQARVQESANDVIALRRCIGELQERLENTQTSGKLSSGLFRMFSRTGSTEHIENTPLETSGQHHGSLHEEVSRLKSEVEDQRRATNATAIVVQDVQQQMATMRNQSEVLREQMEETLREGGEGDSAAIIDRLEELQANFETLHSDHVVVMSVAERVDNLERTARETSSACRQVVQCLPPDGHFCSVSELEQKVQDVRSETQERISILGDTLTRELAQTIAAQITSRTGAAVSDELSAWQEKIDRHETRLNVMENAAKSIDLESLVKEGAVEEGVRDALTQLVARMEILESNSTVQFGDADRTGILLRSEIDVIRSLQKLTGTNLEAVQERVQTLEARSQSTEETYTDTSDARIQEMQNFALTLDTLAAGFVEVRADVDSQSRRIDQIGEDLLRAGQVQNESLEAVSDGIKDYIMNLIVTMDNKSEKPSQSHVPDELIHSERSHHTGTQSVPYSVKAATPSKVSAVQAHVVSQVPLDAGRGSGLYRAGVSAQSGVIVNQPTSATVPVTMSAVRVATTSSPLLGSPATMSAYPRTVARHV